MAVANRRRRLTRRIATALTAVAVLFTGACETERPAAPRLPGEGPVQQFRPLAFIADIDTRTGAVRITAPSSTTANGAPNLSLDGLEAPALSLLGGEAVRLVPSNYLASAVGAFEPNKVRVTFDVNIENKLPGVRFITPTWPTSPAEGVILFPLDYVVTTTPGGVTGGDANEIIVEQPSYGGVTPSIDWNGSGVAGSGAPYSFFNDADCSLAASNDCFRWEAYDLEILPLTGSSARRVGFDIDASVGQFRVRMVVAADLAAAGAVSPGTIAGNVTSPVRGDLANVAVNVSSGQSGTTDAAGEYSIGSVNPGSRTVSLTNLPAGCTTPAPQSTVVASSATSTVNFSVDCTGLPGTIQGLVTRSNDGSSLANVTVTASTGGSDVTDGAGLFSIAGVAAGAGSLAVTGAPAECAPSPEAYTLGSGATITENILVTCTAPPTPGYQYNTTWTDLGGGQIAVDLKIDMRTFNRADITDVTTGTDTGDPLTGAQLSFTYDASKLTFVDGIGTAAPNITAAPTVNGATAGTVSILNGTTSLRTGNVGIARIVFQRVGGATGLVGTTSSITATSSRSSGVTVSIIANVVNTEGTFLLP